MTTPGDDRINVEVTGTIAGLSKAMHEAAAVVEESTVEIRGALSAVAATAEAVFAPLAALIIAYKAFHELTEAVSQTLELAQSLKVMSEKTGIAIEELSALRYAAKLSEVDVETLGVSMQRLARGMEETAKTGKGPAADAFRDLGVSAKTSDGQLRPFRDVLLDLSDKFAKMPDGPRKAALAMDLFGRSGTNLIPLLNRGSEGIATLEAEARQLGVTFSDHDAEAALVFEESIKRLKEVWGAFLRDIVITITPALKFLAQLLTATVHILDAMWHMLAAVADVTGGDFAGAAEHATKAWNSLKAVVDDFTDRTPAQAGQGSAPPPLVTPEKSQMQEFEKQLKHFHDAWLQNDPHDDLLKRDMDFWESRRKLLLKEGKRATEDYADVLMKLHEAQRAFQHQTEQDWKNVFSAVVGEFRHAVDQMIQSGGGFREFMRALWYDLVASSAAAGLQMVANHYAAELAKKNITVASVAHRVAAESAGALKTIAIKLWEALQWIAMEAAKAAASAWSALAGIPIIGPALGAVAAAAVLAGVLSLAGHLGGGGGGGSYPSAGGPVMSTAGGGAMHVTIHAVDASSFEQLARRNPAAFAVGVKAAIKSGALSPTGMHT